MNPVALMRLRVVTRPKDLLDIYKPSELSAEQKYDGHKGMASHSRKGMRIYSRNGHDITKRIPSITKRLKKLISPGDTVLGELTYIEGGKQSLEKVQSILHSRKPGLAEAKLKALPGKLVFIVYDIIGHKGKDITKLPLSERRRILRTIIPGRGYIRRAKVYPWSQLDKAVKDSLKGGGEGAVIKVRSAPYKFRSRGSSEPWGLWWKYKVTRHKTSDVIVTKEYRRGKEKLVFAAYQIDPKGKRIEVGRLSGLDKKTEREVKKLVDSGKEIVVEVSHQGRRPSGKLRDMGWIRLRLDKPARSATMETIVKRKRKKNDTMTSSMANPRKKASKKKSAPKALPKAWSIYLIAEAPDRLYLHSFSSNEHIMPGAAALERALILKSGKDGKMKVEEQRTKVYTEKELRKFLRKDSRKLVPGREQRLPNPRRSLVKEALEAEATRHDKFETFSESYWNDCSRGIYWVATNERDFVIGEPERRQVKAGRFFVACNPELALSGKGAGKKYVAELNVNMLPARSLRAKRGAASTEIRIAENIGKVRVMRTMPASKAKRAFKYQQGLLPSSKEQLRKFWENAWKKLEEKRAKQREKLKRTREREAVRERRMKEDEARAAKKRKKEREKKAAKAKREREKKGRKAASKRKKNPGRTHKVPVRMISRSVNNPGR